MCSLKKIFYNLVIFYVIGAFGYPASDSNITEDDNCIQMTTDNVDKINDLVEKISSFINEISTKYEDIDLRLVEISVDKHSLVENKKETMIHVKINDCLDGLKRSEYSSPDSDPGYNGNDFNDEQEINNHTTELDGDENINESNDAKDGDDDNYNESDVLSDEFSSAEDLTAVDNGDDLTDSRDTEINDRTNNENFNDLQDSDKEESNNLDKSKFDDFGDDFYDFDVIDDYRDLKDKKDKFSDIDEIDTFDPKQNTRIPNDNDSELIVNNNETDDNNYDDLLTKNDETIYEEQEFQNEISVQNNTEIISFININDVNKISCQEVLLLSDEDKLVFKEIERIRGSKPFFLYQRFFENTSQSWFL